MSGIPTYPYLEFSQYITESYSAEQLIYVFENKLNKINDKKINEINDFFGEKPSRKRTEQVEKIIRETFGHIEIHISIVWDSGFHLTNNRFEKYNITEYSQNIIILWGNGFSLIRLNYFGDRKVVINQEISKIYEQFIFRELKEFYYTIINHCPKEYCIYFTQTLYKINIKSANLITGDANEELNEFVVKYLKEKYQDRYSVKIITKPLLFIEIKENCCTEEVAD